MEQAERLVSHAGANKVVHNFAWTQLYLHLTIRKESHSVPVCQPLNLFLTVNRFLTKQLLVQVVGSCTYTLQIKSGWVG